MRQRQTGQSFVHPVHTVNLLRRTVAQPVPQDIQRLRLMRLKQRHQLRRMRPVRLPDLPVEVCQQELRILRIQLFDDRTIRLELLVVADVVHQHPIHHQLKKQIVLGIF